MNNNTNTNRRCTVCGGAGEPAVIRLATGNLALDSVCRLHWPPGALTPPEWARQEQERCQVFPNARAMTRAELLFWLFSGPDRRPHIQIQAWTAALSALTGEADAWDFWEASALA